MTITCINHGNRGNTSVDMMLPTALQEIRLDSDQLGNQTCGYMLHTFYIRITKAGEAG